VSFYASVRKNRTLDSNSKFQTLKLAHHSRQEKYLFVNPLHRGYFEVSLQKLLGVAAAFEQY
jgi:hypothetical protein